MDEKNEQSGSPAGEPTGQNPPVELGPIEKLNEDEDATERTPGSQKPESEVQTEVNPNTE